MFENMSYESILSGLLKRVPDEIDKREGSIIYDAIAPVAAELTQMYINMDMVLNETFADTASREYLVLRAIERGLSPKKATFAVGKGVFNTSVPIGSRFDIDGFIYFVKEPISDEENTYKIECETAGADVNYYLGTLTPIDYIQGLESAEITEILIPGEDQEDTEKFRKRYLESFDNQAFGGNREDYINKVGSIDGVGGCKVYRAWNGGGTVKIVLVDSQFKAPTKTLIDKVQTIIDPTINGGDGVGIAPIDHVVTIFGAREEVINISSNITYAEGWDFEESKNYIEEAVDSYISELNSKWQDSNNIIVRISQIESRLLDLECVIDISDTLINGGKSNFVADKDSIIKRGVVSG